MNYTSQSWWKWVCFNTHTHAPTRASTHAQTEYHCDYYLNRSLCILANKWKKCIIINEWRFNPLSFWCAMCQSEQVGCLPLFVCLPADLPPPITSFKHTKHFLSPCFPAWPSLSLTFVILYYFPYHCPSTPLFLHTFIQTSFSPLPSF